MAINVCLAGASGWAGSELARSMAKTEGLALVAAVSRTHAGRRLGEVLGEARLACRVYPSATEALANPCDVFVEYTKPDSARTNILTALDRGAHVVVGTSGLTDGDLAQIACPYVDGALLAIRKVSTLVGVHRGLDSVLDL